MSRSFGLAQNNRQFKRSLALAAIIFLLASDYAFAEVDYEKQARDEIKRAAYKDAAATLRLAIYKGKKTAAIWLLLGQSYEYGGEIGSARKTYQTVVQYFPNTPESEQAGKKLAALPAVATTVPIKEKSEKKAATESSKHLVDRVYKVPPRFGHSEVEAGNFAMVKGIVAHLPKTIYTILDRGKVVVYFTPNLIDKFPDGVTYRFPHTDAYLGQQFGHTYDREVYVCERTITAGGGTALGPPNDAANITCSTYTQLGHALSCCLEYPSKDEQFLQLYRQDCASANVEKYPIIKSYLIEQANGPEEVFGGLAASLMGDNGSLSKALTYSFPRSLAWIQKKLQILSELNDK